MHAFGHCVPKNVPASIPNLSLNFLRHADSPTRLYFILTHIKRSIFDSRSHPNTEHYNESLFNQFAVKRNMSKVARRQGPSVSTEKMTGNHINCIPSCVRNEEDRPVLKPKRIALVGKVTRYEFEKQRFKKHSEDEFKKAMLSRGSDYDAMLAQHKKHLSVMSSIEEVLKKRGIEFKSSTRDTCTNDVVSWADAIIAAGGDGTFLSAASKIQDQTKPVIGINTNPDRSEGHLCLPPQYTRDLGKALDKLANGQFRWLWRQRIRTTMTGSPINFTPIRNGDLLQSRMRHRANTVDNEPEYVHQHELITEPPFKPPSPSSSGIYSEVLPVLALNEVFIGESLATIPSFYDLHVDNCPHEEQKSSGLCVCTGTGSTAWSYNICRLHKTAVQRVLKIAASLQGSKTEENGKSCVVEESFVDRVTSAYSESYVYEPDSDKMLYSVRDPMQNRVFSCERCNGYARKLKIRSRCWDAGLCIDGEVSYAFNDGAVAILEMLPEDALRTVVLFSDEETNTQEDHSSTMT